MLDVLCEVVCYILSYGFVCRRREFFVVSSLSGEDAVEEVVLHVSHAFHTGDYCYAFAFFSEAPRE